MYRPPHAPVIVLPDGTEAPSSEAPAEPRGPLGPCEPFDPRGPIAPRSPFSRRRVDARIFVKVTAPLRSCLVPTLLCGRVVAAYAPPPSAMNSASVAMTFAYDR